MGDDDKQECTVIFDDMRFFILFKEGDFYDRISDYGLKPLAISSGDPSLGVFRVEGSSSMSSVLNQGLIAQENAVIFLVITPDECVEVVSFSDPEIA